MPRRATGILALRWQKKLKAGGDDGSWQSEQGWRGRRWQSRRHRPIRWEFRACGHRRERNGGAETVRRAARDRQFVATREQMIELHVVLTHLHGVLKTMGGRGRKKRGRRTKDDTSRFIYLVHVALPNLPFGSAAER